MKAIIFVTALLLVGATLAGKPTFTVCNSEGSTLTDVTISSEDNWASDALVHFTVKGKLSAEITAGATSTDLAYFAGYEVDNKQEDLCTYDGTPFSCPEATGDKTWVFPFQIPSIPIAGTLTAHTEFKNADGSPIFCMDLSVDL